MNHVGGAIRTAAVSLVMVLVCGLAPSAQALEVNTASIRPDQFNFSPGAGRATARHAVLWSTGAASAYLTTTGLLRSMQFAVDAQQCEGAPHLQVAVDGVTRFSQEVDGNGYYGLRAYWTPGRHKVTFRFLDDHRTATCDRNVLLSDVSFSGLVEDGTRLIQDFIRLKHQYVAIEPAGAGSTDRDRATLHTNGSLRFRLDSHFSTDLSVTLIATGCAGRRGDIVLTMDGSVLYSGQPPADFVDVMVSRSFADGPHQFVVTMTRDSNTVTCDGTVAVNGAIFNGIRVL